MSKDNKVTDTVKENNDDGILQEDIIEERVYVTDAVKEFADKVKDYDWNTLRTYAADCSISVAGKKRPAIEEELITNYESTISTSEEYVEEISKSLTLEQKMTRQIRCKITSLNPLEAGRKTTMKTVGNMAHGFNPSEVIKFNRVIHLYAPTVALLQTEEYAASDKKFDSAGKVIEVQIRMEKAYKVEILPPLTQNELDDLKKRQAITQAGE